MGAIVAYRTSWDNNLIKLSKASAMTGGTCVRNLYAEAQQLLGGHQALKLFGELPALDRMPEP